MVFNMGLDQSPAQVHRPSQKTSQKPQSTSPRCREHTRNRENKRHKIQIEKAETRMGSRLGTRVVHFTNLPIKLLIPNTFQNIKEISLKTIPSASKIEIKRVLESLYGLEVDKVRTLNMEGKKKKRGGLLIAKPDYKKAYVTLKNPLSLSEDLFPIRVIQDEKERMRKEKESTIVEEGKKHWLDGKQVVKGNNNERSNKKKGGFGDVAAAGVKFPWSSMKQKQR